MKVKAVCGPCRGTGLYRGFAEPKGVAVVCLECEGSGCKTVEYEPFVRRADRADVSEVRRSAGRLILNCGPSGGRVTYAEFQAGKMP